MGTDADEKLYTQAEVEALLAPLLAKIEALELRIARMQRDSSTSSKSPSSDITKPPKGGGGSRGNKKRKPGGQKGHTRHERKLFKPEEIDTAWLYTFVNEEGLLGEKYGGILVCNYFSAYRRCLDIMPNLRVQFCWSHLIRDLKFLLTLSALIAQKYGTRVLTLVRRMFTLWHRRADLTPRHYERSMRRLRNDILKAAKSKSNHDEVRKLAKRMSSRFAESYFTFIDYLHLPGVEPTNNRTERQIRFVVIDRKVTQGTKGEVGKQWCQRIWTTIATCRQRGKQLYHFLVESIQAKFGIKRCHPSLIYA